MIAKWLYKILFLLISTSFAIAVFEIDIGNAHNAFFDEDDTYVQSNNQTIEISSHFEQQKELNQEYFDFAISIFNLFVAGRQVVCGFSPPKILLFNPQKIFLRNSVLRI